MTTTMPKSLQGCAEQRSQYFCATKTWAQHTLSSYQTKRDRSVSGDLVSKQVVGNVDLDDVGLRIRMQLLLKLPCFQAKTTCFLQELNSACKQKNQQAKSAKPKAPCKCGMTRHDLLRVQIAPGEP